MSLFSYRKRPFRLLTGNQRNGTRASGVTLVILRTTNPPRLGIPARRSSAPYGVGSWGARPQGPGAFFWRLIGVREPGVGKGRARSYDRVRDPLLAHFCPMGLPEVADLPMAK